MYTQRRFLGLSIVISDSLVNVSVPRHWIDYFTDSSRGLKTERDFVTFFIRCNVIRSVSHEKKQKRLLNVTIKPS